MLHGPALTKYGLGGKKGIHSWGVVGRWIAVTRYNRAYPYPFPGGTVNPTHSRGVAVGKS